MASSLEEKTEKKTNKFQWFVFTGLIPTLFAIVIALVVLSVAGINVFEKAADIGEKIPFVSKLIGNEDEEEQPQDIDAALIELEGEIKDREAQIEQLKSEIDSKNIEVERAKAQITELQLEIEQLRSQAEETTREFKDIIKTYESMSAKKAAPIITAMDDEDAVRILKSINADVLASILENLSPADAAKYTEMLAN